MSDQEKTYNTVDLNKLNSVKGYWTPEGMVCQGKKVRSGIFVNTTGKSEQEKDRLFGLAKREVGERGEGLECYEVIDV